MIGYLALGSNLGAAKENLRAARRLLAQTPGITVLKSSKIYRTKPYGPVQQGDFLNAVLQIETTLAPLDLLDKTQAVENKLLRTREIHWGPRTLDVDILLYGDEKIDFPTLKVPHPEMLKRSFVLVPLKDVYLEAELAGKKIDDWIAQSGNAEEVLSKEEWA